MEYSRVCRTGGYVGLNEVTWNKPDPPGELQEYLTVAIGIKEIFTCEEWEELLKEYGFQGVKSICYSLSVIRQWMEEIRTLDFKDTVRAWSKFFTMYIKDSQFRSYSKTLIPSLKVSLDILNYFGYCLFVMQKN